MGNGNILDLSWHGGRMVVGSRVEDGWIDGYSPDMGEPIAR